MLTDQPRTREALATRVTPTSHWFTTRRLLAALWRDRWACAAITVGIAALAGLLVANAMPRGPVTTNEGLGLMAGGLIVGIIAGFMVRSRWAMLLAPVALTVTYELERRGTDGPTVDAVRLDSTYGIVAFILGRGLTAILAFVPLLLGVTYGMALARRLERNSEYPAPRRLGHYVRRAISGLTTTVVVALAILIAWPASAPPVRDANGNTIPGSIAELTTVKLGGHDQWIEIRAANPNNPVLLWLSGGPGQSDLAFTRIFFANLTQDFVVVDWDQRGTGKSYPALDPTSTLTVEQMVADTIALTDYLRERFDEEKIYLAGESWGTILGILAIQQRPDLYYAFIGSGQMVSPLETDRRIYRDLLTYAAEHGDDSLAKRLREFGEPPYDDVFKRANIMQQYEKIETDYDPPEEYIELGESSGIGPWGVLASEYTFLERTSVLRGALDMNAVLYPQLQRDGGIDFRRDVPRLDVPIYLLQGRHELKARDDLAREWLAQVEAPRKELFTIENAGHSAAFEGFREFHRIMTEIVVPETYPATA